MRVGTRALVGALVSALTACGGQTRMESDPSRDTRALFGSGTRLKAHYFDAGGGARQLIDFRDTELGIDCQFVESATGQYHCLPLASTIWFADSECLEPAYPSRTECKSGAPPVRMVTARRDDCDTLARPYSVVEQQAVYPLYSRLLAGQCLPTSNSEPTEVLRLAPEPLSRFVSGSASLVGSASGVQGRRVTGDDGSFVNLGLAAEGEPCTEYSFATSTRCVRGDPIVAPHDYNFSDSSCTLPAAISSSSTEQRCAGRRPHYLLELDGNGCPFSARAFALGDSLEQAYSTRNEQSTCEPIELGSENSQGPFAFAVGDSVPETDLPQTFPTRFGSGALTVFGWSDERGVPLWSTSFGRVDGLWALRDGAPCSLFSDPNGTVHCIRDAMLASRSSLTYFSDALCTRDVFDARIGCGRRARYLVEGYDYCTRRFTTLSATKPYDGPVFSLNGGSCELTTQATEYLVQSGAKVDPNTFPVVSNQVDP